MLASLTDADLAVQLAHSRVHIGANMVVAYVPDLIEGLGAGAGASSETTGSRDLPSVESWSPRSGSPDQVAEAHRISSKPAWLPRVTPANASICASIVRLKRSSSREVCTSDGPLLASISTGTPLPVSKTSTPRS